MKRMKINRDKFARAEAPVEELRPQSGPPAVHHPHRIVLATAGKRYEFTLHTEVHQITRGPAKVVEMLDHRLSNGELAFAQALTVPCTIPEIGDLK